MRSALLVLLIAGPVFAGEKLIKNDSFTGTGGIVRPTLAEYEGAGVLLSPSASDYPATVVAVDILCVPYSGTMTGDVGAYVLDVWNENLGPLIPPNKRPDGGAYPAAFTSGIMLTTSLTLMNRFTFTRRRAASRSRINPSKPYDPSGGMTSRISRLAM